MTLDIPTLYAVSVLTNVLSTFAVIAVAARQSIPGLKHLAWALVSSSGFYLVLGVRGTIIPELIAVSVGNGLGALSLAFVLRAVLRASGRQMHMLIYITPVIATFLVSIAFVDDRSSRLILSSIVSVYQLALVLWTLGKANNIVGRGKVIMTVAMAVNLFVLAYRAVSLHFGIHGVAAFQSNDVLNTLFYLSIYLCSIFTFMGFLLITAEQLAENNRQVALKDQLTGLYNRRGIFEKLECLFEQEDIRESNTSVLVVDVDHFKRVNDTHGHLVGDTVICHVANTIKASVPEASIVGRMGGEEFLVVLPNTVRHRATLVAEHLRTQVQNNPKLSYGKEIPLTISIGLHTLSRLPRFQSLDSLVAEADNALFRAKENGRNRVEESAPAWAA